MMDYSNEKRITNAIERIATSLESIEEKLKADYHNLLFGSSTQHEVFGAARPAAETNTETIRNFLK